MMRECLAGFFALAVCFFARPGSLGAQATAVADTAQMSYSVKKGDTLWDIARAYLKNPFRWPEIFQRNTDVVKNPHWIYPGEVIRIPVSEVRPEALGASTANLLKLVMSQGFAMTLAGMGVGALAAFLLTPRVADLLYRVSPRDASVFVAAGVVMVAASGAACFVPAWRATRTDPLKALSR